MIYDNADAPLPDYDGHRIQITLADFSGPHKGLLERGLVGERKQPTPVLYRFLDIVDVYSNKPLFRIEHETRSSTRHPMFNRCLNKSQCGDEQSKLRAGVRSGALGFELSLGPGSIPPIVPAYAGAGDRIDPGTERARESTARSRQ